MVAPTLAEPAAKTRFTPKTLLEQAMIQEIAVSPDGATIVYSRRVVEDGKYRKRLWRVPTAGGAAEPLTTGTANDGAPSFSPDGRTLLFLSDRNGKNQPWLLPLSGGEPRLLGELPEGAASAQWSPDGSRVLLTGVSGEERFVVGDKKDPVARRITEFTWRQDMIGYRDQYVALWVIGKEGGEPVRVTKPEYDVRSAAWAQDGSSIAFVADRDPDNGLRPLTGFAKLWSVPAEGEHADPHLLAELPGLIGAVIGGAGGFAVTGTLVPNSPLWAMMGLYALRDGELRQLGAELDRPIGNTTFGDLNDPFGGPGVAWKSADEIVAIVADHGRAHPYRFWIDGRSERLAGGEIVCTALATAGGTTAVVASEGGNAAEVYVVEQGGLRRVTTNGSDWLEPYRVDPIFHRIPHPDGHELDLWLIEGKNAPKPGPLALQIHGGPHGSHGPTPWLEMLALAEAGIHVIYSNPRGSTGYGQEFTRTIHGDWGNRDDSDLMRAVDWAIEQGIADPNRVGVFGLSYGGYATTWLIGHHPERFKAAIAENPVLDLISMFAGSDLTGLYDDRFVGVGTLPENVDAFLRHSPFMSIHRYEHPLLLLVCEGDRRCPPAQAEMAFAILRSRGRTVEMVRYPDEPHAMVLFGRPDRRIDRMERTVDWFTTYL